MNETGNLIIFDIAIAMAAGFLVLGLIRPGWMIWWMSVQNRIRVIRLYGAILIVLLLIRWVMALL